MTRSFQALMQNTTQKQALTQGVTGQQLMIGLLETLGVGMLQIRVIFGEKHRFHSVRGLECDVQWQENSKKNCNPRDETVIAFQTQDGVKCSGQIKRRTGEHGIKGY